jgi:hypothetical protein
MYAGVLPVLPDPHVPECGLTEELGPLHEHVDAARVGNNLASRAFHPGAMLLK